MGQPTQQNMAFRRLTGQGMEVDHEGAYHDFIAGAQQGNAPAMFNLG
jgi:hypothetical protein